MADLRMPNTNVVIIAGRLVRDPELRYTNTGKAVCKFSIAHDRSKENTDFFSVEAWEKVAENVGQYCKKGSPVIVHGRLILEQWGGGDDKKSHTRIRAHIVDQLAWDDKGATKPSAESAPVSESEIPF